MTIENWAPRLVLYRGRWAATWRENGETKRASLGTNSRDEAERRIVALERPGINAGGRRKVSKDQVFVYFIQCNGRQGPIKIGRASNPPARRDDLQTSNPYPLVLLGYISGGARTEKALHKEFDEVRVRGEWFRWSAQLEARMHQLLQQSAVPDLPNFADDMQKLADVNGDHGLKMVHPNHRVTVLEKAK